METTEEWIRRIGSREALEERVRLRLAGQLNKRLSPPYGIHNFARAQQKKEAHKISCECPECMPELVRSPSIDVILPLPAPKKAKTSLANYQAMTPKHGHKAKTGFKAPTTKWDARCSTCAGTGEIIGILGDRQSCPRCGDD